MGERIAKLESAYNGFIDIGVNRPLSTSKELSEQGVGGVAPPQIVPAIDLCYSRRGIPLPLGGRGLKGAKSFDWALPG